MAEHRAAMISAVSGKRGKRYLKRQQLLELGEPALLYLTEIVHRRAAKKSPARDPDRAVVVFKDRACASGSFVLDMPRKWGVESA